eukprot:3999330-Lingulodinium_polyedra.AAC.1
MLSTGASTCSSVKRRLGVAIRQLHDAEASRADRRTPPPSSSACICCMLQKVAERARIDPWLKICGLKA